MDLMYVNAYLISRVYGGPEEGGWWTNVGEPLCSVPIEAKRLLGHKACWACDQAREGKQDFCKKDIYDEDGFPYHDYDDREDIFDPETLNIQHLVPKDLKEVENIVEDLKHKFADLEEGDIYSALGGQKLSIMIEDHQARAWPEEPIRYE